MNREEYERLKEAEKAHLRKVRALKEQLREARRTSGVTEALRGLDTSGLDHEFGESLRAVQEQSITSEARFELAMEALDEAEQRERRRIELEQFEAEQRKAAAADLIEKMKEEIALGEHAPERSTSQGTHGASAGDDPAAPPPPDPERPPKTIGRSQPRSD